MYILGTALLLRTKFVTLETEECVGGENSGAGKKVLCSVQHLHKRK